MWDYLIFLAYLKDKEKTEYSAAESYINDMISNMDVSWFPINRSLRLELNEQERRSRVLAEESHIFKDKFSMLVHTELGKINTSMRERMTGVEECLKSMADLIHGQQKTMTAVLAELSMDNGGGGGIGSSSPNLKNSLNRKRFAASSPGAQSPLVGMSIRATSQSELLVRSVSKMSLGRGEEERHGELVSSP